MTALKSLCVYCGSNPGKDPRYAQQAAHLGRLMADSGIRLVYGGGGVGLMGIIAAAVMDNGGEVLGVIPDFLRQAEVQADNLTELIVVETMHQRKQLMFDSADAFLVLPGGIGTIEETVEMIAWAHLGRHAKPVGLLNNNGYWDPLLKLFDHVIANGYATEAVRAVWTVIDDVERVLPRLEQAVAYRHRAPHHVLGAPDQVTEPTS